MGNPGDTYIIYVAFDLSLSFFWLIVLYVLESGLGMYIGFSGAGKSSSSWFPPSLHPYPQWITIRPLYTVTHEGVDKMNIRAAECRACLNKQINDIFVLLSSGLVTTNIR